MPRAFCLIRDTPHYRRDAFFAGLSKVGYSVSVGVSDPQPDDLLVMWNRHASNDGLAERFERKGGKVLVCENGYIGKDKDGRQYYAIALSQHNGAGTWPHGGPERWAALNIPLKPWREGGDYILVCGQRGIGSSLMASPRDWHKHTARRLRLAQPLPVRVREHPGNKPPVTPLSDDLKNAAAVVVWSSSAGVKALVEGIPVFYGAPRWIAEGAAKQGIEDLVPFKEDRLPALERMAWAQWSVEEIATGAPFWWISERSNSVVGLRTAKTA